NPSAPELWYGIDVSDFSSFGVYLICGWKPQCVGYQRVGPSDTRPAGAYAYLANVQLVVSDLVFPTVSLLGGTLFSGGTRHGRETVVLGADDVGSGLRGIRIYVNGTLSRVEDYCPPAGDGRYRQLRPCTGGTQRQLEVDTERDPGWASGPND